MYCSETSMRDRMRSIIYAAESLKPTVYAALRRAGKQPSPQYSVTPSHTSPPPVLPTPDAITTTLIDRGCPPTVAQSLSDSFLRSVDQFRTACLSAHSQLIQQFSTDPDRFSVRLRNATSRLERQYRDQVTTAEQGVIDQFIRHNKSSNDGQRSKPKPTFNQEFVPFLEKYFEYNAYPSAPDRIMLAKKSMMTARQIEVWFQNHRNRSKKEGRILRRLSNDPLPLQISIDTLEKRMPFFVIPEHERKLSTSVRPLDLDSNGEKNEEGPIHLLLTSDAPAHAFPMTYPPSCDYEPFPVKNGQHKFPAPSWARRPATSHPPRTIPDFDKLISDFTTKLLIRGSPQSQNSPSTSKGPWFAATRTTAPPAPHPAFIRLTPSIHDIPLSPPLPSISAPQSRPHPFRSPSPHCEPATLVSLLPKAPLARRKVACLPRRTPKTASLSHRGVSPATSDATSPSRSLSSSSRSSSFTSATSSSRRSSSFSSSSSPSAPSTPVLGPMALPEGALSPSISGLDFQDEEFIHPIDSITHIKGFMLQAAYTSNKAYDCDHLSPVVDSPQFQF